MARRKALSASICECECECKCERECECEWRSGKLLSASTSLAAPETVWPSGELKHATHVSLSPSALIASVSTLAGRPTCGREREV